MSPSVQNGILEHPNFDAALSSASADAAATMSTLLPSVIYKQAGRTFITTSFPVRFLVERVKLDTMKKGDDPDEHINRPLIPEHHRAIEHYLRTQEEYILPGITLSIRTPLTCHTTSVQSAVKLGFVVLPVSVSFAVTDGQHRIKALEEAIQYKSSLAEDAVPVTISYESDIDRIHQDFVDCAQVKPIPASLLTAFNRRDPLARLTRRIIDQVPVFQGRVEKAGKTVGKNSINLFTMNQVRAGIAEILVGDSMQAAPQLKSRVEERLPSDEVARAHEVSIVTFLQWFTEANSQWREVAAAAGRAAFDEFDAASHRQRFVHFTATGLVILGRVGYSILRTVQGAEEQREMATKLGELDWSRSGPLWQGSVVTDNKVITSRVPVERAIAKTKKTLGLPLTDRDELRLASADQPGPGAEDTADE